MRAAIADLPTDFGFFAGGGWTRGGEISYCERAAYGGIKETENCIRTVVKRRWEEKGRNGLA